MEGGGRHIIAAGPRHRPRSPNSGRYGALAAALLLATGSATAGELLPGQVAEAIEYRIEAGYYDSVIVAVSDGEQREFHSFTPGDNNDPQPRGDTLFPIASLTKPFTAALMVERIVTEEMSLETPLGEAAGDELALSPGLAEDTTLIHLATHTAGLPSEPSDLGRNVGRGRFEGYDRQDLYDYVANLQNQPAPGEDYNYSNLGYALLGEVLSAPHEESFSGLLEKRITGPLGLEDTVVDPDTHHLDRLITGHDFDLKPLPQREQSAFGPAVGLYSTPEDMIEWLEAHMNPHDGLPDAALAEIIRPRIAPDDDHRGLGLGWHLLEENGHEIVWHSGRTEGHAGFAGFERNEDRAVVILTNTANSVEKLGFAALDPDTDIPPLEEPVDIDPGTLALYPGRYQISPGFVLRVRESDGHLYVRAPGRPNMRLYPSDHDRFFTRGMDTEIRFLEDEAGAVRRLEIQREGDVQVAHRMEPTQSASARTVAEVDRHILQMRGGMYELADGTRIHVDAEDDRLLLHFGTGVPMTLEPAASSHFFHAHRPTEIRFPDENPERPSRRLVLYHDGEQYEAERIEP